MTWADIQSRVANRLNLTSTDALTRIGQEINERYREVMSSCGLNTSVFQEGISANTVIGQRSVVFSCEKIYVLYDPAYTPPRVLGEVSMDDMRNRQVLIDPPMEYAIAGTGASTVTVYLDVVPATIYALKIDGEANLTDLSGVQVPAFPQDFHDILTRGVMADELYTMEKYALSAAQEKKFEDRLAHLQYFIAKSGYLTSYQGKNSPQEPVQNWIA